MLEQLKEIICNYVEVEPEQIQPESPFYGRPGIYVL